MPTNTPMCMVPIYIVLAMLVFPVPAHAASLQKPPNNLGLVGYWSFNDGTGTKAGDFSGQGNHGTLTGGPSWGAGKLGKALNFDGFDDYVVVGDNAALEPPSELTISAWVKYTSASNFGAIAGKGFLANLSGYGLFVDITTKNLGIQVRNGVTASTAISSLSYGDGSWHHVMATRTTGSTKLYVDGAEVASDSTAVTLAYDTTPFAIGMRYDIGSYLYPFSGVIDDVRIYNRALGANEITRLYASGASAGTSRPQAINTNGLVGHWSFDECRGTSAQDVSVQGNNVGTLSGFAYTGTTSNWVSGTNAKRGCALAFDGVNDYVQLPNVSVGTTYTASLWVKPDSQTSSYGALVYDTYTLGNNIGFYYRGSGAGASAGKLTWWPLDQSSTGTLIDQQWNHVAVSVTGGTARFYINGVGDVSFSGVAATTFRLIGQDNAGFFFKGSLDDVRIYNRALSASEIKGIYNEPANEIRKTTVQTSSNKLTQGTSLATGLVGHWTFDGADMTGSGGAGTAKDISGSNNHGTLAARPTRTLGRLGQALSFVRASGQYVSIPIGSSLAQQGEASFAGWLKLNNDYASAQVMISNGSTGSVNNQNYVVEFGFIDNKISLWHSGGGPVASSTTFISDNNWHHYAVVRTGSSGSWTVRIYIDGVLDSTTSSITTNPSGAASDYSLLGGLVNLGGSYGGYYTNGTLDDIRVYSRALSATEVKSLYNLGR